MSISQDPVSIVLVGVGGYGASYVQALRGRPDPRLFRVVGAVDPAVEPSSLRSAFGDGAPPFYRALEEFYGEREAELAIISTPIHTHCRLTRLALSHGSNVLCEKPAAATIQEVRSMIEARERAGRFVAIGYQWSFLPEIQALKRDIQSGRLGRPIRLKTVALWPRDTAYYRRGWAGLLRDAAGEWVLDSPVNNATAHFLHNMFYVLGPDRFSSARPAAVTAELYRANAITNFDTGALRATTDSGVEILFYSTHASDPALGTRGPICRYEFENATVVRDGNGAGSVGDMRVVFRDGSTKAYDAKSDLARKLWQCIAAVRSGEPPLCGLEAAAAQTVCVNGAQDSTPRIVEFPANLVRRTSHKGADFTWVSGLSETLMECYEAGKLPSEMGAPWARPGKTIDLRGYRHFPGGRPPTS